ncbi:MAG: methyltransferase domain-containing protein [Parachlamydiales bacterium]|nr:methyltransferase domain-containing protein [Candidatus Acheromyda pituitae]
MASLENQFTELPLETPHLSFALEHWKSVVGDGDWIIDATCGRGRDTLKLARLLSPKGSLIGIDIQIEALRETQQLLQDSLTAEQLERVHLFQQSHAQFPSIAHEKSIALIVYNLGYLPQGDKSLTTMTESTLQSIGQAMELIRPGGLISITCYPGHVEGKIEQEALIQMAKGLPLQSWDIRFYRKINSETAPSVLFIKKKSLN